MPSAPEATGLVLDGRYELQAVVGEGSFGRVYRARDRRLDRVVAVKVIKPWWAEDPAWARAFEREARLLARVSDPAIVQIFDVGQSRAGLYYVAELIDGESLAERLERGPLPSAEARQLAEQLCRALGRAHAERVVHRDVKPANVLISSDGRVKLGDFGVARLAEGSTGGTAGVVGTPRYMAPEQARGNKTTPATDVYSAGVVLYEMLSGAPPFSGSSAIDIALSHLQDAPPPLPPGVPSELRQIVERALVKDPSARYRDGREMASALARARGTERPIGSPRRDEATLVARKLTPRRRFNPAARRRSLALLGLVGLLLAGMILAAVLLAPPARVRMPRLYGMTRAAIVSRAERLQLRTSFTTRYAPSAAGRAIAQRPSPGTRIDQGATVNAVLSAGPPPVEVPRLSGEQSASAQSILGSLGLRANVSSVPAPGTAPGSVVSQTPDAGRYLRPHATVSLTVAETPQWRVVTSVASSAGQASVPFRIRGEHWRIVYRMDYVGMCSLIFFCDGPNAQVVRTNRGSVDRFGLSDGGRQTRVLHSGPGVYRLQITPGSDTARWSAEVEDYY
jgi:serine/threonine-protein kinase